MVIPPTSWEGVLRGEVGMWIVNRDSLKKIRTSLAVVITASPRVDLLKCWVRLCIFAADKMLKKVKNFMFTRVSLIQDCFVTIQSFCLQYH